MLAREIKAHILMQKQAREAIACVGNLNISLGMWTSFTQLNEALAVCRSFPGLKVVINHTGGPVGLGTYANHSEAVFDDWRKKIEALAQCPNAAFKLGGLAMKYGGFDFSKLPSPPSSDLLVKMWRPYVEACIQSFAPSRCIFESNFPIDRRMCNYHVLWDAFKKVTQHTRPRNGSICRTGRRRRPKGWPSRT